MKGRMKKSSSRILAVTESINERVRSRFGKYSLEFSIGICRLEDEDEISQAMNKAMHASRLGEQTSVCSFYQGAVAERIKKENYLNTIFEDSLKSHDFYVYLQPKVSAGERKNCEG